MGMQTLWSTEGLSSTEEDRKKTQPADLFEQLYCWGVRGILKRKKGMYLCFRMLLCFMHGYCSVTVLLINC